MTQPAEPSPYSSPLQIGPPALWVARFGLPVGGGLLDSGTHQQADYADVDVLALHPAEVLCREQGEQSELLKLFDGWQSRPFLNENGEMISARAWSKLSQELDLPLPLTLCALSYELGSENLNVPPSEMSTSGPRLWAARYPAVYLWDRRAQKGVVVGVGPTSVEALIEAITSPLREERSSGEYPHARVKGNPWLKRGQALTTGPLLPRVSWLQYQDMIQKAQFLFSIGEVYQLNLTIPMETRLIDGVTPEEVFTRLREVNSGQFGALFVIDDQRSILSLSPERLVSWGRRRGDVSTQKWVETAPIKGTRPRFDDPQEDERAREELLKSVKDRAEHVMILDLERNDLVKICEMGSVEVIQQREVKTYPTVHHLVSVVRGKLREEIWLSDLLNAVFPGGSVTGAPKLRALQHIQQLESGPRGVYCGALGYLDPMGGGDLNLPIRTAFLEGQRLIYHAGGGIVADSTATEEWEELWVKTRGIMRGLGLDDQSIPTGTCVHGESE